MKLRLLLMSFLIVTVVLTERVSSQLECESVVDDFKSLLDKTEKKHVKYICSSVLQLKDKE